MKTVPGPFELYVNGFSNPPSLESPYDQPVFEDPPPAFLFEEQELNNVAAPNTSMLIPKSVFFIIKIIATNWV